MGRDRGARRDAQRHSETAISNSTSVRRKASGFGHFGLHPKLVQAIEEAGYTEPRPIQAAAIPSAMQGRDVLGLARTGTGKTAAFVLPILHRLGETRRSGPGPRVLVVTPTRELSVQVNGEFEKLGARTNHRSTVVFGGVNQSRQVQALRRRPDIVVACPGRLLDLHSQGEIALDGVEVLVLDEADHMFDMGFLPDVKRILRALPKRRQNLLFSATMPREIRRLTDDILRDPKVVELEDTRPVETIEHSLLRTPETGKQDELAAILRGDDFTSGIVFTRTKSRARRLAKRLAGAGHSAVALQGNMSQNARDRAMKGFRSGEHDVLVATDIAARGIDVEGVSHVVNYDVPNTPEAYTHRIGRTGRSERSGVAITFVTPDDTKQVKAIERHLGARIDVRGAGEAPRGRRPEGGRGRPERAPRGEDRGRGDRPAKGRGGRRPGARSGARSGGRPDTGGRTTARRSRPAESGTERGRTNDRRGHAAARGTAEAAAGRDALPFGAIKGPGRSEARTDRRRPRR